MACEKAYIIERTAYDAWSWTGVMRRCIAAVCTSREAAEDYVKRQPENDGDGSGWYQWSYKYKIIEMEYGVDYATDEDEDEDDDDE